MPTNTSRHIQPYLARVVAPDGDVVGTAFQVQPGVLVTAWHVLRDSVAPDPDDPVKVCRFGSDDDLVGTVLKVDCEYDLATVRVESPLDASVGELVSTWSLQIGEPLEIQGVAGIEDPGHDRTDVEMPGAWYGRSTQGDIIVGRMNADAVVGGMSGAPVRLKGTDRVVGVVTQRYDSGTSVMEQTAWVALSDDLKRLVADLGVEVTSVPPPNGWNLTLAIDADRVTLSGDGPTVWEPHHGVGHGLRDRLHDVRRARANAGGLQRRVDGDPTPNPVSLAITQVSTLLSDAFMVGAVRERIVDVLKAADAGNLPVRIGIQVEGPLAILPWEALEAERGRGPLALHHLVTMVRQPTPGGETFAGLPGPLRILVVIASPEDGEGVVLGYERELGEIVEAVKSARRAGAQVRIVEFGSLEAVNEALKQDWFHVIHFSGHGSPGSLVLEDQDGKEDIVDAKRLIDSIPARRMPPVVTLAACYTAVPDGEGESLAKAFLDHGAKAVVATETSVTDRYATELVGHLYKSLADGGTDIATATADARRAVQRDWVTATDERTKRLAMLNEWSTVTLYTRQRPAFAIQEGSTDDPLDARGGPGQPIGGITGRNLWDLVGRRTARRQWPRELLGPAYSGLVIHGIGGIGKTTLAADLMERVRTAEPDRVIAALTGQVDTDMLLAKLVSAVSIQRYTWLAEHPAEAQLLVDVNARRDLPWQQRLELLTQYVLAAVPTLLVLDNFEDNLAGPAGPAVENDDVANFLLTCLTAIPTMRALVTCRHLISLPDEAHHRLRFEQLQPLTWPETQKLAWNLPALDALASDELQQVWQLLGGHPRSLEYCDALLRRGEAKFADVRNRLIKNATQQLKSSDDGVDALLAQERTLNAALAETVALASTDVLLPELMSTLAEVEGARRLVETMSVFRHPVDNHAVAFQLGVDDESAATSPAVDERAVRALFEEAGIEPTDDGFDPAQLSDEARQRLQSLLNVRPTPPRRIDLDLGPALRHAVSSSLLTIDADPKRFFVHRWTADEIAKERQAHGTQEVQQLAHERAAAYYRWRVEVWPQDREADAADLLEARYHLLEAGDAGAASEVAEAAVSHLHTSGQWDREAQLIASILSTLQAGSADSAKWLHQLGILAQDRGDYNTAETRYQQSLDINERLGNQAGMATSYHQLGILAQLRGDYNTAETRYQQSLDINERLGNQAGMATSYHQLGILAQLRGDYNTAETRYQQSLDIEERLGNQSGMASSHSQLGILRSAAGHREAALPDHLTALAIRLRLGVPQVRIDLRELQTAEDELGRERLVELVEEHAPGQADAVLDLIRQLREEDPNE